MEELPANWLPILSDLGTFGILVWYLWYRTAISDPKREAKFCETIDATVAKFDTVLRDERVARRADIDALCERLEAMHGSN